MHPRLYRLTELHQRIDDALRSPRRNLIETSRLMRMKTRVKRLMNRMVRKTVRI